ncbi:hypothetical protein SNE40_014955 [Patella caerulea]
MLEYNYTATYTPGSLNVLADCMSRLPMTDESEDNTDESTELEYIAQISTITDGMITDTEFKEACTNDSDLQNVLSYISTYWPNFNQLTPELKVFHRVRYELSTRDGILFRHDRLVIPKALPCRIIQIAHTGHFGMTLVKRSIRQFYWWPTMDTMIDHVIKNCVHCNTSDKPYKSITAPLTPIPLPERVWQKLALDIQGPYLEAKAQHKFVIIMIDFYSKWDEVKFCSTVTTEVVIEFLSNVFYREGIPETLVTDNGVQFVSYQIKEFLQRNNITHLRSSLYHPETNGLVERMNKTIKEGIQLSKLEHRSPVEVTKERLQVYHSTPHTSTGITPFTLMRGRTVHTQLTIPKFHLHSMKNPALISKVQRYQDKYAKYHSTRHRKLPQQLRVGDYVRVRRSRHFFKGEMRYTKPFKIIKLYGCCATLSNGDKYNVSKLVRVNHVAVNSEYLAPKLDNTNSGLFFDTAPVNRPEQQNDIPNLPRDPEIRQRPNRIRRQPRRFNDYIMN